jgi:hypothetical protein
MVNRVFEGLHRAEHYLETMKRLMIPAVLALAALSLVGCSASNGASDSSGAHAPAANSGGIVAGTKAIESNKVAVGDRQVIKTGSMTITAKKPSDAADKVSRIVESAGGRIDSRTEHKAEEAGGASAQLIVRIPSAKLTATLDKVKKVGTLEDIEISSSDVTTQSQDLDARISALRTSVQRLQALMASATSTQDLITVESALSERQGNLESLEAQKRDLKGQVDLSTITVNLDSPASAKSHLPGNFFDGIVVGWNTLVGFLGGLLVGIGVALPWIVLGGGIGGGIFLLIRWRRKARTRAQK